MASRGLADTEAPRDRNGTFEPVVVTKRVETVASLGTKGLMTGRSACTSRRVRRGRLHAWATDRQEFGWGGPSRAYSTAETGVAYWSALGCAAGYRAGHTVTMPASAGSVALGTTEAPMVDPAFRASFTVATASIGCSSSAGAPIS